jgi:hypothetical protein
MARISKYASWGSALWHFLHTISFNFPVHPTQEQKAHYFNFMVCLRDVLPEKRDEYNSDLKRTGFLEDSSVHLASRDNFSRFIYTLSHRRSDYKGLRNTYELFRASCVKKKKKRGHHGGCTKPLSHVQSDCIVEMRAPTGGSTFVVDSGCVVKIKKRRNSSYGFNTAVWGPALWHFLHTISFDYKATRQAQIDYKWFLISLGAVLPCRICRDNYSLNLKETGFCTKVFQNRDTFSRFIYKLHETVRRMQGKKTIVSYLDLRRDYESLTDEECVVNIRKRV